MSTTFKPVNDLPRPSQGQTPSESSTSESSSTLKHCSACGTFKPLSDFHRDTSKPSGHRHVCKACVTKYDRGYWQRRKQRLKAQRRLHPDGSAA